MLQKVAAMQKSFRCNLLFPRHSKCSPF